MNMTAGSVALTLILLVGICALAFGCVAVWDTIAERRHRRKVEAALSREVLEAMKDASYGLRVAQSIIAQQRQQ